MIKKIFGKNVKFTLNDDRVKDILLNELSLYLDSKDSDIDAEIIFVKKIAEQDEAEYISPSIHVTYNNGFLADYSGCKILYKNENILKIYVQVPETSMLIKFISVDFNTAIETVGTILHELVLVPMTYFFDDITIVHASSFKNNITNEVYLIGGTGGVGKTSLELLYCKKDNYSFISDDIAVIDNKGNVYPNLSYPKIYAYNVAEDKEFEKVVLSNDSLMGKIQWNFIRKTRGDKRVRRRLSPVKLYNDIEKDKSNINNYIILTRNNMIDKINLDENISTENIVQATLDVIYNEYSAFHDHIKWHEYNCIINNIEPTLKLDDIFKRSQEILTSTFKNVNKQYIKIPKNYGHQDFMNNIEEFLK